MTFPRAALYLQVPALYCRWFGGLRWDHHGEAVEFLDGPAAGLTFAFAPEVALFLEGFRATEGGVPAFGHILHLLYLIGLGERAGATGSQPGNCLERIAGPFRDQGRPLRNAGALCAALCADAPRAADPPEPGAIHEILTDGNWVPATVLSPMVPFAMGVAEEPGLDPDQFEFLIGRRLDLMSDLEIRHWLRYGRGPAGRDVERLIPHRPRSVSNVFSDIEQQPRLAGALALATRLEGMLWLPSRRLDQPELQGGGYADVTTRGAPELILPIQFALDGEEFIRRFAERELLYFHREEPHEPRTEELVLLLDQGVRTWGDVRLVLSSAAIALSRQAQRRRVPVKLAGTSNGGEPIDLAVIEPKALSALIEASDLTPHPGQALERLLASADAARRDVVILTHPRSLLEPEVMAAARDASSASDALTRLFSVSVDSTGQLELAELRRGLPIVLARSRIEVEAAPAAVESDFRVLRQSPLPTWNGDFEPTGFHFRCGLLDVLERSGATWQDLMSQTFDFDESGERILAVGLDRLLFTCKLDGTGDEHLPMPVHDGKPLILERRVIGVAGGFVVPGYSRGRCCLAHYDFPSRTCVVHRLGTVMPTVTWSYFRDLHAIALNPKSEDGPYAAVDLSASRSDALSTGRARRAVERARAGEQPFPLTAQPVWSSASDPWIDLSVRVLRLDSESGLLHFRLIPGSRKTVLPLSDGEPALKGGQIVRADRGGDVLAVLVRGAARPGLYFISSSSCAVVGVFPLGDRGVARTFALSRDGRRFAVLSGNRDLEVREVSGQHSSVFVAPKEEVAIHFASLGRSCMLVREVDEESRHVRDRCLIRWDRGRLEVERHEVYAVFSRLGGVLCQSRSLRPGDQDSSGSQRRFVQIIEEGRLRILIDRYNHFVVFDSRGNLVCVFYVIRDEAAALLVDGTYWGSRRLVGRDVVPGAAERIGRALLEAEGVPESSS